MLKTTPKKGNDWAGGYQSGRQAGEHLTLYRLEDVLEDGLALVAIHKASGGGSGVALLVEYIREQMDLEPEEGGSS